LFEEKLTIRIGWAPTPIKYDDLSDALRRQIFSAFTKEPSHKFKELRRLIPRVKRAFKKQYPVWSFDCTLGGPLKYSPGEDTTPFQAYWKVSPGKFHDLSPVLQEKILMDIKEMGYIPMGF
jgi:hypothetical protein